ncbi:MAG: dihydrofolate reductase family protein [Chloroflexota bacterium]
MRKVIASTFVTLDGVMQAPAEPEEIEGGGWQISYLNDESIQYKFDELVASDALLMGRVTYELLAGAWPSMTDEGLIEGFAGRMNSLPKYVASTTLTELAWNNSRLIKGNLVQEVAKLKHEAGQDILVVGSSDLVHQLTHHDLIDEYRLMIPPVVAGNGKHLFRDGAEKKVFTLLETKTFSNGVVVLSYRANG